MAATINTALPGVSPGLPGGNSSALNVTAEQVIKPKPGILNKVICVSAGTITLNDLATTSGPGAANEIYSGSMTAGQVVELDCPCFAGILVSAVTGGQFSLTFT